MVGLSPETAPSPVTKLVGTGLSVGFGGIKALSSVDISLDQGGILGVIGPNGAGKTTLVNVLTGFQRPDRGDVLVNGQNITRGGPRGAVRAGVVRSFQAARLFHDLTVAENVEVALCAAGRSRRAAGPAARELLDWMDLGHRANLRAGDLSFGEERLVGIARTLGSQPRFLLLDEPAAGLNEVECAALSGRIRAIPAHFGCGLLLIEHNMDVVLATCPQLVVLDRGHKIADGPADLVRRDETVIAAYLGVGHEGGGEDA